MADRHDYGNPAANKYGKPGYSLPTPEFDDLVIVETKLKIRQGQRWKIKKGTPHPVEKSAVLLTCTRTVGDDTEFNATYVYATPRVNQDAYDAAISYTAQSTAHRIFARSSLVARDEYVPLPALAPDSVDPLALCTQETQAQAEAPYGNLYLRVTRTFENFGTMAEQDAWNRSDALPYLLATFPKITRRYRFPATADPIAGGVLISGTSTDSAIPGATLTSIARQDESSRVRVYTCVFDSFPSASVLAGLGVIGSLGVAVTYPYVSTDFPRITWTYLAKDAASQKIAPLSACPIPGYTTAVLLSQSFDPTVLDGVPAYGGTVTRVYEVIPTLAQQATFGGVAMTGGLKLSVEYPYGDTAFPVLTLAVSLLNDNYAPVAVNAACPVPGYASLVLTDEKRAPDAADPVKTALTLEYQILPGCIISSTDAARIARTLTPIPAFKLNGDLLTTTVQLLPYLTAGVPTVADTLSLTLLSSRIEPHGKWYVTKTNISRANPVLPITYLPLQVGSADGADGAKYSQTVQVAPSGNDATDYANLNAAINAAIAVMKALPGYLIDYNTEPGSPTQAELTYTLVNAFPVLAGQDFDARLSVALPYTEQIMTAAQAAAVKGNPNTTITPERGQDNLSRVRVSTPPTTFIDAYIQPYARRTSVSLPEVLNGVTTTLSTGTGVGGSTDTGSGSGSGSGWTVSDNAANSCEGSASVLPEITPNFASRPLTENLPAIEYFFYVDASTAGSETAIIARLNTLLGLTGGAAIMAWPVFTPRVLTFSMFGQKVSVSAKAQARLSASSSSGGNAQTSSSGSGYSEDVSTTIRTATIRESLHGAITVNAISVQTATATASASKTFPPLGLSPNASVTRTKYAYSAAIPGSYPASGTYPALPTSGKFLQHYDVGESAQFSGRFPVRAIIFDFAVIGAAVTGSGGISGGFG